MSALNQYGMEIEARTVEPSPVTRLSEEIEHTVADAIRRSFPDVHDPDALVRGSDHADFQSNAALPLAAATKQRSRDIADALAGELAPDSMLADVQVAGPGFLNLTLTGDAIWRQVEARLEAPELGLSRPAADTVTVIDYSSPNVAKQMHVGHLRSTVIGDTLARLTACLGAQVVRQNHVGDWGTQFGMLIQYLDEHPGSGWDATGDAENNIARLDALYRDARNEFDTDDAFAQRSRDRVVALQNGDEETTRVWRTLVDVSADAFQTLYDRLGIGLDRSDIAGESTYNPLLDDVVRELVDAGVAVESDGALCVFFDEITGPSGDPVVLIVRKKDGGYGYAATDLATLRYRVRDLHANEILYVVDARQSLHFRLIFETAARMGWVDDTVSPRHIAFGTVLGADGTPFKTRAGDTVPLASLLDDAVQGARAVVATKNPDLEAAELDSIARAAGIGAVKYAELSTARNTDYRFDVAKMVALQGNTGVYLQYAYTRTAAVLDKADHASGRIDDTLALEPAERALALHLDGYESALRDAWQTHEPHRLASYLYSLAKLFSAFYENCPILPSAPALRANRLQLTRLTQRTLRHGLDLLGIDVLDRM